MQKSEQLNELAAALAKAQAAIKQPVKARKATIKSDKTSYSYSYADLPAIIEAYRAPFAEQGLSIIQSVRTEERCVKITTMLLHSSGQWVLDELSMSVAENRPQAVGSAITYGRRYAISAMVGIAPDEDDDGAEAQAETDSPKPFDVSNPVHIDNVKRACMAAALTSSECARVIGRFTGTVISDQLLAAAIAEIKRPSVTYEPADDIPPPKPDGEGLGKPLAPGDRQW